MPSSQGVTDTHNSMLPLLASWVHSPLLMHPSRGRNKVPVILRFSFMWPFLFDPLHWENNQRANYPKPTDILSVIFPRLGRWKRNIVLLKVRAHVPTDGWLWVHIMEMWLLQKWMWRLHWALTPWRMSNMVAASCWRVSVALCLGIIFIQLVDIRKGCRRMNVVEMLCTHVWKWKTETCWTITWEEGG
jgi:hypothetical protein